jgi:hypothetical protein
VENAIADTSIAGQTIYIVKGGVKCVTGAHSSWCRYDICVSCSSKEDKSNGFKENCG